MEEQNKEDPIDALEETPPDEDFKTKIEDIYFDLPQSIKLEYQDRLKKHNLEMTSKVNQAIKS